MNADTTDATVPQALADTTTESTAASRRDFIKKGTAIGAATFFSTLGHSGVWCATGSQIVDSYREQSVLPAAPPQTPLTESFKP